MKKTIEVTNEEIQNLVTELKEVYDVEFDESTNTDNMFDYLFLLNAMEQSNIDVDVSNDLWSDLIEKLEKK